MTPATPGRGRTWFEPVRRVCVVVSFALLLLVGMFRGSSAKVDLGDPGWAPGTLPYSPSSWVVATMMYVAYALAVVAVALALWRPPLKPVPWWVVLLVAGLALMTGPIGTADHTNYAAYGRISAQGGDSYSVGPVSWRAGTDPVTSAVEPPWEMTPNVYGPLSTMALAVCSLVAGANLRQTVWMWQVLVVLAWLGCRWALLRLAESRTARARVDSLFVLNPLVFGILVLGAHMDVLAGFMVLLCLLAMRRHPGLVGLALGAAASMKITYGVVGVGVLWAWRRYPARTLASRLAWGLASFTAVFVGCILWSGTKVFGRLMEASKGTAEATMWGPLNTWGYRTFPGGGHQGALALLSTLVTLVLVWMLAQIVRPIHMSDREHPRAPQGDTPEMVRDAMVATFVLNTAYCLAARYELPWYETITWLLMPLLAMAALELVVMLRSAAMIMALIPGRSREVSAGVDLFTLFVRNWVMPLVSLGAVFAIAVMWRRRWHGRRRRQALPRLRGGLRLARVRLVQAREALARGQGNALASGAGRAGNGGPA